MEERPFLHDLCFLLYGRLPTSFFISTRHFLLFTWPSPHSTCFLFIYASLFPLCSIVSKLSSSPSTQSFSSLYAFLQWGPVKGDAIRVEPLYNSTTPTLSSLHDPLLPRLDALLQWGYVACIEGSLYIRLFPSTQLSSPSGRVVKRREEGPKTRLFSPLHDWPSPLHESLLYQGECNIVHSVPRKPSFFPPSELRSFASHFLPLIKGWVAIPDDLHDLNTVS